MLDLTVRKYRDSFFRSFSYLLNIKMFFTSQIRYLITENLITDSQQLKVDVIIFK